IEAPIERLDRVEDLAVAQVRVVQWGDLHTVRIDELRVGMVKPAIFQGLAIEVRARIGRGKRHLDRMRVDLGREADRLLDRLLGLPRQAEDEGAMNGYAQLVTVLGEAARELDAHSLLDVEQDLLVSGF